MLDRAELKEIASTGNKEGYFASLYLNVDPLFNKRGDYDIHFKNMVKHTAESLDKAVYKQVKGDIGRIEDYVASNKRLFRKGLVLISSTPNSFWKEYHLSVPVRNELVVEKTPYTAPLADILDNYERYAVLLAEKEDARIFVIHLGEIVEYRRIHTSGIPGKHKQDVWYSLAQVGAGGRHMANMGKGKLGVTGLRTDHYERHIDFHVRVHVEDAVKGLDAFVRREQIGRVVIGGSDEAVAMAKSLLSKALFEKVIGTVRLEMFADANAVLDVTMPVVEARERQQEEAAVETMLTQALSGGNAVLGLADVLSALQEKRVMRLVVRKDYQAQGYKCGMCGFPSAQEVGRCPACGGEMEYVEHMADMAEEMAVQQGAVIEVVEDNERLARYGGIGAFLRF